MNNPTELRVPEHFFFYKNMKQLELLDLIHYSLLAHQVDWNLPAEITICFAELQTMLKVSHPTYKRSINRLIKAKLLKRITKHKYTIIDFREVAGEMEEVPDELC